MKNKKSRSGLGYILVQGLEEGIRFAKGELALKTTVVEIPDSVPDLKPVEAMLIREKSNVSQPDFAKAMNVTPSTLKNEKTENKNRPGQPCGYYKSTAPNRDSSQKC